ncbi:UDP-glycosyltransferase UGT5-like isoform X2 [Colias croceus]|uniref:UDP-glycosyltransferase UGT5-like isoform X2 n=1 Tax=Colias crocea TaxID=72248 RepID=UPI001E281553|nr:UDP-glycosyltransferase UGT5-like isoform X2 [Colias croceus]
MTWLRRISVVFLFFLACKGVESASILALFSSLSFSDHLVFRSYISLLVQRGHSVVMMTPYPGNFNSQEMERIVELNVGTESAPFWEEYKRLYTDTDDYFPRLKSMNELSLKLAIAQLKSKPMTSLLINPNVKFDLVITEADVPLLYAIAEKYQTPHISITTSSGKIHQYESKGTPIHPILYPDVNTLSHRNLTRWQKIVEIYRYFSTRNEYYNHYLPLCDVAAKKMFGLNRELIEVEYDIDILLIASNPLLIGNRPTVPAISFVDRLQIKPGFPLQQELKTILDSAPKGVIYFSFGAIQEPEHLSSSILQTLADAFREMPFTVLWKIGNTTMVNLSGNVIANVWFPQQEILAHPNVKAFITHGGPRSLEEAIFYEVPIIGLPTVRSRKVFISEITRYGAGEILDIYSLEKEALIQVLTEVATNNKYKNEMIKLKSMVVSPVISGPDNAVWWTEYVLRNGGAKYLRSPAVGISFVKYYMLDIAGILLSVSLILLSAAYFMLRIVYRRLYARFVNKFGDKGKFKAL